MHEKAGEGGRGTIVVDAGVGGLGSSGRVVDGPGDGDFGGCGPGVGDTIAQDCDGKAALVGIVGDEGAEGFQRYAHGEGGICEIDACKREFAGEGGGGEADQAGSVLGAESTGAFVGRLDARFEHAGDGLAGAGLHPDGREGVGWRVAFVGAIEDFPIAELAASTERYGAGGDTSEGKGDGGEAASGKDARVGNLCGGRRGGTAGVGVWAGASTWVAAPARATCWRKVRRLVGIRYRVLRCADGGTAYRL